MIILHSSRQEAEIALQQFFKYINLHKQTRLNNVRFGTDSAEDEYIATVIFNCLLEEIEIVLKKKLVNTVGHRLRLQFSDAQGALFYKALGVMPLPAKEVWLNNLRNKWRMILHKELCDNMVFVNNMPQHPQPAPVTAADHYED